MIGEAEVALAPLIAFADRLERAFLINTRSVLTDPIAPKPGDI